MGNSSRLTDVDFWMSRQPEVSILPQGGMRPRWFKHVAQYLPTTPAWSCLEVGVVPGSTLLFMAARLDYLCTGVDFSPRVNQLKGVFAEQGIAARFIHADFMAWETSEQFDLVYSCGFIEHFERYQQVIEKHWALVKPGGMMLLTVPTMTPVPNVSRLVFYARSKMKEVESTHNFEIMDLGRLCRSVSYLPGSEIVVSSYTSEMELWYGAESPGIRPWTKPLFLPLHVLERIVQQIGISSRWFSPNVVVLARKSK